MFAKLKNGKLKPAPREFIEDGRRIVGFTDDFLRAHGYKSVIWAEPTSEAQIDTYTEDEYAIYQTWVDNADNV